MFLFLNFVTDLSNNLFLLNFFKFARLLVDFFRKFFLLFLKTIVDLILYFSLSFAHHCLYLQQILWHQLDIRMLIFLRQSSKNFKKLFNFSFPLYILRSYFNPLKLLFKFILIFLFINLKYQSLLLINIIQQFFQIFLLLFFIKVQIVLKPVKHNIPHLFKTINDIIWWIRLLIDKIFLSQSIIQICQLLMRFFIQFIFNLIKNHLCL